MCVVFNTLFSHGWDVQVTACTVASTCLPTSSSRVFFHTARFLAPCAAQARGRRRNRFRRTFRQSYRLPISLGLKVGCINTQGLRWDLTSHAEKLKALLLLARQQNTDVVMLTELHYDETVQLRFQVVYMEEWLLICRGQVGLLLRNSVAQLWEQQGRPSFALDASDRLAGIAVCIHGRKLALVSMYSPAGADVGSKRRHYTHAQQLATC